MRALANQAIAQLGNITPYITPAARARRVVAYVQIVASLQAQGWLAAT